MLQSLINISGDALDYGVCPPVWASQSIYVLNRTYGCSFQKCTNVKLKSISTCFSDNPVKGQKALLCTQVKICSKLRFWSVTGAFEAVWQCFPKGQVGDCPLPPSCRCCPAQLRPRHLIQSRLRDSEPQLLKISRTIYLASSCNFALISFHWEMVFRKGKKKAGEERERVKKYVEVLLKNFCPFYTF